MVLNTVRFFPGRGPSNALANQMADRESCFARFAHDPESRLWVCARVGAKIFSSPLSREDEWVMPGGGEMLLAA